MTEADTRKFDYQKVGQLDADMWRAYYNHQFLKLFLQLIELVKHQLGLNWWLTLRMAYHSAWAAADYRLHRGRENYPRAIKHLSQFYKIISENSVNSFDYHQAASLELEWWDIHRYPKKYKKTLEASLADTMAVVYGVPAIKLKNYAHYRAEAMLLPEHKGDDQHQTNWQEVSRLASESWKSLHEVLNGRSG